MTLGLHIDDLELGELYAFRMKEGKGLFPHAHLSHETFVGRVMGFGEGFIIDLEEGDEAPIPVMPEDVKSYTHVASRISGFLELNVGAFVNLIVKTGRISMPMMGKVTGWNSHPEEIYFFGSFSPHGAVKIPVGKIFDAEINTLIV